MKRLFCFILLAFSIVSCTDNDDVVPTEELTPVEINDPTKLAKVIFDPGSYAEEHWNFYTNGLLKEIKKKDGTVKANFVYDANNNLISTQQLNSDGTSKLFTFTYDTNGFITSPDIHFDSSSNSYVIGDVNHYYSEYKLNSDKLLDSHHTTQVEYENDIKYPFTHNMQTISYSNKNIVGISVFNAEVYSGYSHDNKINPLRNATIAISRAFVFNYKASNESWYNSFYNSYNNVISESYSYEDPESAIFQYEYNSNDLPVKRTCSYYYLNTLEGTRVDALYYYQGDVIPK
jgi:hypothetical protein